MGYITSESRYSFSEQHEDTSGKIVLSARNPYRFEERSDNIFHLAGSGDTWYTLAERYYGHISDRAGGLWWVICDYQVPPVVDPTLAIRPGIEIVLPPPVVVASEILAAQKDLFQ
jgi:hypothetical protein